MGVQLERGTVATAYQSRVTIADITEAGQPDCYGLGFFGERALETEVSLDMTSSDKVVSCLAIHKDSDSSVAYALSHSEHISGPSFSIKAPASTNGASLGAVVEGTSVASKNSGDATYAAPWSGLLTLVGDLQVGGNTVVLTANGVDVAVSTTDPGGGFFGNKNLIVGDRGNNIRQMSGWIYGGVTTIGEALSAQDLADLKNWHAERGPNAVA